MNRLINGLMVCCSFGASMLLAAPAWSVAASDPQGNLALPAEPAASMTLEELDEIVLRGKRLEQRVAEAEASFYKRYSQLNGKNDFDVSCEFYWEESVSAGSRLTTRKRGCVPVFYLKAVAMDAPPVLSLSCMRSAAPVSAFGGYYANANSTLQPWGFGDSSGGGFGYGRGMSDCQIRSPVQRISPRANLVYLDKRGEFVKNLIQVMRSDPQLETMASELDALVAEGREGKRRAAEAARLRRAESKCARPISPRIVTVCGD